MKRVANRLLIFWAVLQLLAFSAPAQQQTPIAKEGSSVTSDKAAEVRQQTFEIVWKTVNEKHFDPNFNGVDWKAVHEKYAPLVAATKTDNELYPILSNMLKELKESHFAIIPPSADKGEENASKPGDAGVDGDLGMDVRAIGNQIVVTQVLPKSTAEKAGLKPGFIIDAVDDKPLNEMFKRVEERHEHPQLAKLLLARGALAQLEGPVGSTVKVHYIDGNGDSHDVNVKRQPQRGEPAKFGNLPIEYVEFDAHKLKDNIGYIQFNIFLMPTLEPFKSAMKEFKDSPGVIIDLRGNPGGLGTLSSAMSREFFKEQTSLGTMKMRNGNQNFVVFANPNAYQGTVVIITDEGSASTSEVMAGGLQELKRAIIVGQTSAGAVLPSYIEKLPNGAVLQFAIADYKTPKGVLLEGVGVHPDYEVPLTRASLLAGHDAALEKAIAVIEEMKNKK
ncbi:MAG TPA: S41 family peptidase [Blastocatellia bacterium]|nr:S41 family peptidase [Blastocatellia bacterium]